MLLISGLQHFRSQGSCGTSKNSSMFEICVEHTFAAAHALRNYYGKCENVHGHNTGYRLACKDPKLDETGLLFDFAALKKQLRATSDYLDHQFLNELKPFDELNPSAENIARFICEEMQKELQAGLMQTG